MARATVARIDTSALRANADLARALAPRAKILACVKADAYGHGLVPVAEALSGSVEAFAVACIEEALELRAAGLAEPVLLLEGPHTRAEICEAFAEQFVLCLCDERQLDWFAGVPEDERPKCWLKVDTGMHRLGFAPGATARSFEQLRSLNASPQVLCTHFASADAHDSTTTDRQLAIFDSAVAGLTAAHSCANSAAILAHPRSHRDWVRPGYMLYGGNPLVGRLSGSAPSHNAEALRSAMMLKPAMEFCAEVIAIRDIEAGESVGYGGRWHAERPSRIATIAAGYGDGYPRDAPDGTPVRIGTERSPLAGRVSMDMITVDVTDNPAAHLGAWAILWGADPGIDEVAHAAGTIGYELLAGMPKRVRREVAV